MSASIRGTIKVFFQVLFGWMILSWFIGPVSGSKEQKGLLFITPNGEHESAIFWRDPGNISTRNLFYGPGGETDAPQPGDSFTFVEEDLDGTNPKFVVKDQNGIKWTVKPGDEARPETVASRLVWGIGYFANEDYFLPTIKIAGLPAHPHRGKKFIEADSSIRNVRLKRHLTTEKKIGYWKWKDASLLENRELNGLRTLMALLNNWDLTDQNNGVYSLRDQSGNGTIFMVSDLGSTFGIGNLTWPEGKARGDLAAYEKSAFITKETAAYVDFNAPKRDSLFFLATPREFIQKLRISWIGKQVPRTDAKWVGDLLGKLSPQQIRDAFRSAGYSSDQVEGFATAVEERIKSLENL